MTAPNGEREELENIIYGLVHTGFIRNFNSESIDDEKEIARRLAAKIISSGFHKLPKAEGWPGKIRQHDGDCRIYFADEPYCNCGYEKVNQAIEKCLSANIAEKKAWEAKVKELEGVLECWHDVFGTTQLTHAEDRMRVAEELNKKWEARSRGICEIYEKYKDKPTALKDFDAWQSIKKFAEGGENESI